MSPGEKFEELRQAIARLRALGLRGAALELKAQPRFWFRILRHTWRLFMDNRGPYQANALAYRTMLSLVPMLVFIISLSAWLFGEKVDVYTGRLKEILKEYVMPRPAAELPRPLLPLGGNTTDPAAGPGTDAGKEVSTERDIVDDIWVYVERFKEEAEAGTRGGFAILLLTSIFLINGLEMIFNNIWHIKRRRPWALRILAYTALTVLIPVLFGLSIYMTAQVQFASIERALNENVVLRHLPLFQPTWGLIRDLGIPLATVWILFLAMYKWLPNTKVETISAAIGALLAAAAFEGGKWAFSFFTAWMVESRQLYWGPIGIFIVFLIWVYLIWWIALFCAQLTYVIQNYRYVLRQSADLKGHFGDAYLACRLMLEITKRHYAGKEVPSVRELAQQLKVDLPRIQRILSSLLDANLLLLGNASRPSGDYEEVYVPGRDPAAITLADVIQTITDAWRLPPASLLQPLPENAENAHPSPPEKAETTVPEITLYRLLHGTHEAIEQNLAITFRQILEAEARS